MTKLEIFSLIKGVFSESVVEVIPLNKFHKISIDKKVTVYTYSSDADDKSSIWYIDFNITNHREIKIPEDNTDIHLEIYKDVYLDKRKIEIINNGINDKLNPENLASLIRDKKIQKLISLNN